MILGEAPIYRVSDSTLHWVDYPPCRPASGAPTGLARVLQLEDSVSVFAFRKDVKGSYICAYYGGIALTDEETGKLDVLKGDYWER